jgi:hypothetical protein
MGPGRQGAATVDNEPVVKDVEWCVNQPKLHLDLGRSKDEW